MESTGLVPVPLGVARRLDLGAKSYPLRRTSENCRKNVQDIVNDNAMEEERVEVPNKASVYASFLTCLLALGFSMRSVDLRLRMRITPAFRPKARSPSRAVRKRRSTWREEAKRLQNNIILTCCDRHLIWAVHDGQTIASKTSTERS